MARVTQQAIEKATEKVIESKRLHVVPQKSGWVVEGSGDKAFYSSFPTKKQAVATARRTARSGHFREVIVHRKDGSVQDSYRYLGKEPYPPRKTDSLKIVRSKSD